jgi:hypothetical protein
MHIGSSRELRATLDTFYVKIPDEENGTEVLADGFYFVGTERIAMQVEATDDFDFIIHQEGNRYRIEGESQMSMIFPWESSLAQ